MSSPTRSTSTSADPRTVVIALGSNLGDREYHLRRAIHDLRAFVRIVRVSAIRETEPVDAPPPKYLNAVAVGYTYLEAEELLRAMLAIERAHGRVRTYRNAPRPLDLDLIRYSGASIRTAKLEVPHPRYLEREFVTGPMRELHFDVPSPARGRGWREAPGEGSPSPGHRPVHFP